MNYTHLTQDERYQIHTLKRQGLSLTRIAAELQRHPSSISRELRRNATQSGYKPIAAHTQALSRQGRRRNAKQFSAAQWAHVETYLRLYLSPQQASGRLKLERSLCISHECIYQHVYQDKAQGGDLAGLLRCQKVRRKRYASGRNRRGILRNRTGIEHRPAIVDARSRMGDWEGDTMIGKAHRGVLVTLVERRSRYTLARALPRRHSDAVSQAVIELLRPHKQHCKTLTFDNGKEFAQHEFIAQCLQAKVYFAHPYCSWQRGLNENHNGLLRQFFPKRISLLKVTQSHVDDALYWLNHRPRKCLNYRTPHEVFFGLQLTPLTIPLVALCA